MDLISVPVKTRTQPWREIDGRAVIVDTAEGRVHELNPVATVLWKSLDGTRSVRELAEAVMTEFDVSADEAERDALHFLEHLSQLGLIRENHA